MGEFIVCQECGDELEVVSLTPIKLDWAYADPYDEDDEWDEDDFNDGYSDDYEYEEYDDD